MSAALCIETSLYTPNPDKPGYLSFVRYLSYNEINEQIKKVLLAINPADDQEDDYNAYSIAEWFSEANFITEKEDGYTLDSLCEGGRLTATFRQGNNEGCIIEINHMNPKSKNSTFYNLASIKYLVNEDEVWHIVRKLNDAITEGR